MSGPKTNEREGTRAVLKYCRVSPYKVRVVLDLIRGEHVQRAREILRFSERDAAIIVGKLLDSAIANAGHNDDVPEDELFVSACFADEGPTLKRFRYRARGRATRVRKRTCHVTVIVSRLPEDRLARHRASQRAEESTRRARRIAGSRRASEATQGQARGALRRGRRAAAAEEALADEPAADQIEAAGEVAEASAEQAAETSEASAENPPGETASVDVEDATAPGGDDTAEAEGTTESTEGNE